MKAIKIFSLVVAFVLMFTAISPIFVQPAETTVAEAATAKTFVKNQYIGSVKITGSPVNVHAAGNYSGKVLTKVYKGAEYECYGISRDSSGNYWYYINYASGKFGYVVKTFASYTPHDVCFYDDVLACTVTIKSGYTANVRKGPSTSTTKLGTYYSGKTLLCEAYTYDAVGTLWYRVEISSTKSAYIRSDLVNVFKSSAYDVQEIGYERTVKLSNSNAKLYCQPTTLSAVYGYAKNEDYYKDYGIFGICCKAKDVNGNVWYCVYLDGSRVISEAMWLRATDVTPQ